jgi:fatty acyl-CoA reductase
MFLFRHAVCSSMTEPVPGWLDNLNGPAGILLACGKGLMHSTLCNTNKVMDFSPVDVAIKGMIVAVWKNGVERSGLRFAVYVKPIHMWTQR